MEIPWVDAWVRWERNSKTEVDDDDVDDDEELPPSTERYTFTYPTNGNDDDINLDIKGFADDSEQIWNSTGLALWRSSRHLCQYLVSEECKILIDAKSVLELGSGLGRCGLLAHHLTNDNATTVLTDGDTFRQEEKQKMNKTKTLSSGPNMHTTCLGIILSICCVSGQSTDDESATTSTGAVHVSTSTLLLSAFPLLCIAYILRRFNLGVENRLLVGIVRAFVQLSILGLILHPIFLMGMDMPWLVGLCEYSFLQSK